MNASVSLDKKTKEVGPEDCVNQNLDGSVQEDVADSDSGLKENMSDEGLISKFWKFPKQRNSPTGSK